MSRAVCDTDRVEVHWSASQGARLADHPCPICFGQLRPAKLADSLPEVRHVNKDTVGLQYPHDWPDENRRSRFLYVPRSGFPPKGDK